MKSEQSGIALSEVKKLNQYRNFLYKLMCSDFKETLKIKKLPFNLFWKLACVGRNIEDSEKALNKILLAWCENDKVVFSPTKIKSLIDTANNNGLVSSMDAVVKGVPIEDVFV